MKKLKLKFEGIAEMLSKEQMKKIKGGYFDCGAPCTSNMDCHDVYWTNVCVYCAYFVMGVPDNTCSDRQF